VTRALWLAALVAVLALPAGAAAKDSSIRGSVVGGTPATVEDWPFVTGLVVRGQPADQSHFCGGSVADAQHVITAAHCIEGENANALDVVVGRTRLADDEGGERIPVASLAIQPAYDSDAVTHDVAVLRLARPIVAPAPIVPAAPEEAGLAAAGQPVRVAGWGLAGQFPDTTPDVLQQAALTVMGPSRCRKAYGNDFDTNTTICAGTPDVGVPDSCSGDSGGPLVADGPAGPRLVGIVSYGSEQCGDPASPAAYTRVSNESAFIAAQLGGAAPVEPPPPTGAIDPRATIGRIWCGKRCYVEVGATGPGAEQVPALAVRVRRSARGRVKAKDSTYSAKRLTNTRWRAKISLPLGNVRISARAVDANGRTLGKSDRVYVQVTP
jgi:secreted trypsin-like serine protease